MRLQLSSVLICGAVAGCADISKILPTAPASFQKDLQQERTVEAQLISDLRNEDRVLMFLSRGYRERPYGCGDPRDPRRGLRFSRLDPSDVVKKENAKISKEVQAALDTIDTYNKALIEIKTANEQFHTTINTLKKLVDGVGGATPISPYVAAIDAGLPLLAGAGDFVALGGLQRLAINMTSPLQNAVSILTRNSTELTGAELIALQLWDECARETLAYLRDVPLGYVKGYRSFVAQSTGVELQTAYNAYLAKKAQYQSPNLKADLQAILDQNKALAAGVYNNPDGLIEALSNGTKLATEVNKIVNPPDTSDDSKSKNKKDDKGKDSKDTQDTGGPSKPTTQT